MDTTKENQNNKNVEENELKNNEEIISESVEQENTDNSDKQEEKEQSFEDKYLELNDKFIRLYSEFDNYRKRSNKEKLDLISTASEGVLKDMLTILDDFERAIANNEQVEDVNSLKEGFNLIYNKFKNTLESKGLKAMESVGQIFDSELHEAIANIPAPSDDLKGKVVDHVEKGYYLHEKVIRFAKVVVGQ
ncbi:MAG: nucleotide exchange factor GrpE [Flavobacteriia bacterium]|nr:nucleotide exchange factor GrpE [Flavobacteriia bacterium]